MRDRFKFRVWNKLSNTMTYNFMFGNFMQKSLEDYEKKDWVGLNYEPDYICFNNKGIEDNLVIMQCTGLKDKNNKLIYEGDIVKGIDHLNRERLCYVHYSETYCSYFICGDSWSDEYLFNLKEYEIVGNIYENKELLE